MFNEIPRTLPSTPLLDLIDSPQDLRKLEAKELTQLAQELRAFLLFSVGQTGGHFGAGLGVVELTIALHYIFDTPNDKIVWDVGHQCYPHKILTERRSMMSTLRRFNGLAGFPKRDESIYDTFGVGHSSTSISAALGMAVAAKHLNLPQKTVAVIGDGAMTAGMAFEALHHAAHTNTNLLVILNDNQMSISHNQGGLATYFAKIWASKTYTKLREGGKKVLEKIPPAWELARRTEEHMKGMVTPGTLFEELGFNYIGLIDGHDLDDLTSTLKNIAELKGPQLLHITTCKGKGFFPAELDPVGYHAITKIEPQNQTPPQKHLKFQDVFGAWLCHTAKLDSKLIGITPAMGSGSGMNQFANDFPEQFHDVAIAEQHAVTFAAGLACQGLKPVVAIYSTFLQRAYDQLIHDVALQNLDVLFAIDRAGLVGADGPTHHGSFDISFLNCIPNMLIVAPSCEKEMLTLLNTAYQFNGPAAIRYPRGQTQQNEIHPNTETIEIGNANVVLEGQSIALLCFGPVLYEALTVASTYNVTVIDMRFIKPLDNSLILELANTHSYLITIEENAVIGGAGSVVESLLSDHNSKCSVIKLGIPDKFITHGSQKELRSLCNIDAKSIEKTIKELI
jgi:1-deoxy-D-xylulose-5-phosphate synthase